MKILFYNHTGKVSGAERVLLRILAQLNRKRFEPVLLCPADGSLQDDARTIGVPCGNVNELQARFTWRLGHLLRYLASFISVIRQVRARVIESQPEIVHANSIRAGLVISVATIGLRKPIIWHIHDLLPRHPLSAFIRLFVLIVPPVRIVAVSQAAGDRLCSNVLRAFPGRVNVSVIHNSVDAESFRLHPTKGIEIRKELRLVSGDVLIGIVGNLSPTKGQLELITAFADVLKRIPDAALLIVGAAIFNRDDGYQQQLVTHANALGIANRVRFLGHRGDVAAIMNSLDLLVLNSTSEAFPLVALEGLACGVPLLCTAVGGLPELITHGRNGWLIPPGDQRKLREAILLLIEQPHLRARLARNGQRRVETNFTLARFMSQMEALYGHIRASHSSASHAAKATKATKPRQYKIPAIQTALPSRTASSSSSIAVFHDNFAQMGGAERVAEEIYNLLPGATLHTTAAVREILSTGLRQAEIRTSWMQYLPGLKRHFRHYFLFYPFAVELVDLSKFDLIVSSCFGYAKGVRKRPGAVHVCYCHTPMRWVWRYEDYSARAGFGPITRKLLPILLSLLKRWDRRASRQPDYFIANSQVVAERIKKVYGRGSVVIPPPIDVNRFQPSEKRTSQDDYYLVLSRLVPYKRIDLAVEACTRLNRRLLIVGDGPDRVRLEKLAGPTVRFLGRQSDEAVAQHAAGCRALLFPGEEDFGMTPLEVNAAGRPVIAFRAGGALETVVEGTTGLFFDQPTTASLIQAIEDFELRSWNPSQLRAHACGFDRSVFRKRLLEFLREVAPDVQLERNSVWDGFALPDSTDATLPALRPAT
ncbi:MAG: glycosyltransferase [Acidobacteriota bacterium]|nr:glycosyltransferase [Acidobacteriota bacterium]